MDLEETPSWPVLTSNASGLGASLCMTPITYQASPQSMADTVTPCTPSISATPGFSAFKRVIKEPVSMQSEAPSADSSMSPHTVSAVLTYLNHTFHTALLLTFLNVTRFKMYHIFFVVVIFIDLA